MTENFEYDAVVVGSGPNGLSCATTLAAHGLKTVVIEGADTPGGGARSSGKLTLPGFHHDVCSAVHPTAFASPVFKLLDLERHGLKWIFPPASAAHPLDGEPAALLRLGPEETAEGLGRDCRRYRRLVGPLVESFGELMGQLLSPLDWRKDLRAHARFGLRGLLPATTLARLAFKEHRAKALLAGCAAHSILPLEFGGTAAVALVFLLSGHLSNWPIPKGGSVAITEALLKVFRDNGGEFVMGEWIRCFEQLPSARRYVFDLTPDQLRAICGERLSPRYRRALGRFRYGPGVFKMDYALSSPIPWRDPACLEASTVHVGGIIEEIAASERAAWQGRKANAPFVMVCQQSQFDPSRAPTGNHTGYAYCHVPNGCPDSMQDEIERQIERFAPGFRDCILARHSMTAPELEAYNPAYRGGAITGGATTLSQLFTRPVKSLNPYRSSDDSIYLCSQSTPPGGGVHGMCGYNAATRILKSLDVPLKPPFAP